MTRTEVLEHLKKIFMDVMDLDELVLQESTTAADVEEWDSLSHVRLMISIERGLGVRFSGSEIGSLQKVGDLVDLIVNKKSST